ncbi:MAG: energy transducer TonB [Gemmatirosa sp.]|nr:energy transducer TonB [Gemmatirosa sp.]
MVIHLIETQHRHGRHLGPSVWSAVAHAALVASVVAGAVAPQLEAPAPVREVVYLLPQLPSSPRPALTQPALDGRFAGEAPPRPGSGFLQAGPQRDGGLSAEQVQALTIQAVIDSVERPGSPVYVAADLDRTVERDPTSAGPAYPPELEIQRVEGLVAAEWVVDTAGVADTTTFHVVAATHAQFASAVRTALPLMRFRPAELLGQRVRQMVRQEFMFRIRLPEADSARAPLR